MNREILATHGIADLAVLEREKPLPDLDGNDVRIYHSTVDSHFYPERITETRIAEMRNQNVSDALMFDAAFHGALLLIIGPLMKSFGYFL